MASFCYECAILMGFDSTDFKGMVTREQVEEGYVGHVLCEDCGPIFVDQDGRCLTTDCDGTRLLHGHRTESVRRVLRTHEEWVARRLGPLGALWRLRDTFLGTPYAPGLVQHWRWRYHDWLDRRRGIPGTFFGSVILYNDGFEIFEEGPSCYPQAEPSAGGIEAPSKDTGGPTGTRVLRDEDVRPILGGTPGHPDRKV